MNKLTQFITELGRVPIIPLVGFPGTQLTGKSIKNVLTDSKAQIDALLAIYETVQPDALFTMMDLTVEAQYLGCELKFPEFDSPTVKRPVLYGKEDINTIFANRTTGGRMDIFADVVLNLKKTLKVPICAYVIGPYTLAGEIMDINKVMRATKKDPGFLHEVLENVSRIIMNYVSLLEASGVDLICILEPSAMMISSDLFNEFSGQYCKKIISEGISVISVLHICGNTNHIVIEMEKTGADGLSLDKQVKLPEIYGSLQAGTVLIGNIDPVSIVTFGDAESVRGKSQDLVSAMRSNRNFILSTGCDIPANAPIENIQAIMSVKNETI